MDFKRIEEVIYQFDNHKMSNFPKYIENRESLNDLEKDMVKKIWKDASRFELWNHSDLNKGKKNAYAYLIGNYDLNEKACTELVKAISYEWI